LVCPSRQGVERFIARACLSMHRRFHQDIPFGSAPRVA
jgi:hypothetical protein